jgi:hypothetical protein
MSIFDSRTWTGRQARQRGPHWNEVMAPSAFSIPAGEVTTLERPVAKAPKSAPIPQAEQDAMTEAAMAEYAELAEYVGIMPPDLGIETFKAFLRSSGMTVFSLSDVITYMDEKAKKESKDQAGWEWRPLREKDHRRDLAFGVVAEWQGSSARGERDVIKPASDYYRGPRVETIDTGSWGIAGSQQQIRPSVQHIERPASSRPYDRTIPIHAVRKIAQIEKTYAGDVAFFVCDYALAPAIQYPDPFLMAVVPNLKANIGVGRFIIDFWDEPGFGIEHMLKSDL